MKISVFWFRRDLRIDDNTGFWHALNFGLPVMPIFIFDPNITDELSKDDARISFIYKNLEKLDGEFKKFKSSLRIIKAVPEIAFEKLINEFEIEAVFSNNDYEPYAIERDSKIENFLKDKNVKFFQFKDQVIFEKAEILKNDGSPFTIFTPYKNAWLRKFSVSLLQIMDTQPFLHKLYSFSQQFPKLKDLGFEKSNIITFDFNLSIIPSYAREREILSNDSTTFLGPHLRFGTISIRKLIKEFFSSGAFVNELIWREFFMQILANFPRVVNENFKMKYNQMQWLNRKEDFERWCNGQTGYPLVDAGMNQLNTTGYMHNRVRMIVASFLCKHLLIDWRWGEAYFAQKLLDFELSSNNGNWQWAAGTGCDAAPYFRVFNPITQQQKFDPELIYVKKWLKIYGKPAYPKPIIEHSFARLRAINTYKSCLEK